jgi:alpha-tubulin suppressor-like RCC1 family protein
MGPCGHGGSNSSGQLGNNSTTNSTTPVESPYLNDVLAIAAGGNDSYALKRDGTVWAWGDNGYGRLGNSTAGNQALTPVQVSVSGITAIAAGYHALAIDKNQTVWAWGRNNSDQLGDGQACGKTYCTTPVHLSSPTGAIALAGGTQHGLAATSSASAWAWGDDGYGELGNGQRHHQQEISPTPSRPAA